MPTSQKPRKKPKKTKSKKRVSASKSVKAADKVEAAPLTVVAEPPTEPIVVAATEILPPAPAPVATVDPVIEVAPIEAAAVVVEPPPPVAPRAPFRLPVVSATAPVDDVEQALEDVRTLVTVDTAGVTQIDAFGRDPEFEKRAEKVLEVLYRRYFRVSVRNIEAVPSTGPVLLVANHSGSLPLDGAMLKLALSLDHPAHRRLRPLAENFVFHFPFVGTLLNRFGAVRACQENAEALLKEDEAVAVFPEGVKGLGKPFARRYQLQRFGRGGFIRLALRTKTPIVPVAIVGAEETNPVLARLVRPGRTLGLPYLPVTPTFPLMGPLGLMPLPTKWTIEFGNPIMVEADESADDLTIARLTEDIRGDIQGRLDKLLAQRTGWFR